jgi:hypothetical protein
MLTNSTKSLRFFQLICLILVSVAFWLLRQECLDAEVVGAMCLSAAADPFTWVAQLGTLILNRYWNYAQYEMAAAAVGVVLVFVALLWRRSCSWWCVLYLVALVLSGLGELAALKRDRLYTLVYHLAAFAASLAAFSILLRRAPDLLLKGWIETRRLVTKVSAGEVVFVLSVLAFACVNRFYQLNRNPSGYDAEACPHRLVADSWRRILEQEVGSYVQQSSGMSWVLLHKLFTRLDHPTLFYLDERLLGVAISLLGCIVMYFFMRNLRGVFAAMLGLVLYVLGPLDLEWSRLPVMHHIPVVLALLLAWATFNALSTQTWRSFLPVALLIPITKFVYPSAKLALFGPLAAVVAVVCFRRKEWRGKYSKLLLVFVGVLLFVGIRSLVYYVVHNQVALIHPFDNPYPSDTPVSRFERIKQMLGQGIYFFYEVFYAPASPTHWTNHATVLPARSLSSFTVVFLVLAFTRLIFLFKRPEALVFVGMIVGGLIPGMATELADRRIAVSLVLCLVLGILEFCWLIDTLVHRGSRVLAKVLQTVVLVSLIACLGISQTTAFFTRDAARPIQMEAGDSVLKVLKDDTLVVYLAEERRCEMFYSLYTRMRESNGSIAFATAHEGRKGAREQILAPEPVVESGYYTLSHLNSQIETLKKGRVWRHYLFVFQPTAQREEWRALLKQVYPQGKETLIAYDAAQSQRMALYEVDTALPAAAPVGSMQ